MSSSPPSSSSLLRSGRPWKDQYFDHDAATPAYCVFPPPPSPTRLSMEYGKEVLAEIEITLPPKPTVPLSPRKSILKPPFLHLVRKSKRVHFDSKRHFRRFYSTFEPFTVSFFGLDEEEELPLDPSPSCSLLSRLPRRRRTHKRRHSQGELECSSSGADDVALKWPKK